jgi:glucose/mannose-6-phosphate isomerase
MTLEQIKSIDPKGMYQWIKDFPQQVEAAVKIGKSASVKINAKKVRNIVLTGLGGSAIGGDLLRSYLAGELGVPFLINRHYALPNFVGPHSLVIVSSYSGNTEETIAAHKEATKRKAQVLCIATGGETAKLATKFRQAWIRIPAGLSPRAALGYSFFPLLVTFEKLGFIKSKSREIKDTIATLGQFSTIFSDPNSAENVPLKLAEQLKGKLPVVYSAAEFLDAINVRWRGQVDENAKQLAFGHVLPEMNHNELVGWNVLGDLMKQTHAIFLQNKETHPRVAIRQEITKQVVGKYASGVTEVRSVGKTLLARMFYLIHFGDWVSLYLAILNNQDPEPVEIINYLKNELAKV